MYVNLYFVTNERRSTDRRIKENDLYTGVKPLPWGDFRETLLPGKDK